MGSDQDCQTHKFFLSGNDQQCRIAISVTLTYGLGIRARDLGGLGGGRAAKGGNGGGAWAAWAPGGDFDTAANIG